MSDAIEAIINTAWLERESIGPSTPTCSFRSRTRAMDRRSWCSWVPLDFR